MTAPPPPTPDATSPCPARRRTWPAAIAMAVLAAAGLSAAALLADDRPAATIDALLAETVPSDPADGSKALGLESHVSPDDRCEPKPTEPEAPTTTVVVSPDSAGGPEPTIGPEPADEPDPQPTFDDHDEVHDAATVTFTVDGDRLTHTGGDDALVAAAERVWRRFTELIPADQRTMLVGFESPIGGDFGGYVYPDHHDPTRWILGVSADLGPDEDFVLIHEFAHLLTLQASEVPPGPDFGACPTYHTGEGCALAGSTFAEFVARFWPPELIDELFLAEADDDWEAWDDFFQRHADRFVTDYAASNPAEDLAETFTVFVLDPRPTGTTIAHDKLRFLWDDPGMVDLRSRIRAAL